MLDNIIFDNIYFRTLNKMNPSGNYPYPYPQPPPYGWYYPYYPQSHDYYSYYNSPMYSAQSQQNSYYSPYDYKRIHGTQTQVIKIEEGSDLIKNQSGNSQNKEHKKQCLLNKKKSESKPTAKSSKVYHYAKKMVKHKARYFDPNAAPVVTTSDYNLIKDSELQNQRNKQLSNISLQTVNQIKYPQKFQNPFIVFKYRRIKKKFKKYVTTSDNNINQYKNQQSQSQNDSDDSDSSQHEEHEQHEQRDNNEHQQSKFNRNQQKGLEMDRKQGEGQGKQFMLRSQIKQEKEEGMELRWKKQKEQVQDVQHKQEKQEKQVMKLDKTKSKPSKYIQYQISSDQQSLSSYKPKQRTKSRTKHNKAYKQKSVNKNKKDKNYIQKPNLNKQKIKTSIVFQNIFQNQ